MRRGIIDPVVSFPINRMPIDIQDAIRDDLVTSTFSFLDTIRELRAENAELRNVITELRSDLERFKRKFEELGSEVAELRIDRDRYKRKFEELESEFTDVRIDRDRLKRKLDDRDDAEENSRSLKKAKVDDK